MNKKIYVVTQGEYSHGILGVFDDKEIADVFKNIFEGCVIEYKLNPESIDIKDKKYYFLRIDKKGNTLQIYKTTIYNKNLFSFDIENNLFCYCFAKDEKHAIKIANEKRVQLIANNEWGIEKGK